MLHIMVVDDEAPIRDWLVYCIQKCEAASSVTSAVNGEEAYRRILEQKPNVVFTDIRMPGMDGLELMSKVRDILPFTVFIILTNYAEFSYAKQAISLGAREYILKSEMRSSDIQRIVAEIAATTAKIRSEKVHDVLQDGVVDLYEMYRNFEQPGAVAAFWQRQGLRPGQPYLAFCVANDSSLDLRRQMVALASASRAPFSAAAMVQEHLYLLLQCPEAEALRGYALDTEAALGECRPPACPPCAPTSASSSVCWGRRRRLRRPASSPAEGWCPTPPFTACPPLTGRPPTPESRRCCASWPAARWKRPAGRSGPGSPCSAWWEPMTCAGRWTRSTAW